jgi:hypothetical protein
VPHAPERDGHAGMREFVGQTHRLPIKLLQMDAKPFMPLSETLRKVSTGACDDFATVKIFSSFTNFGVF